MKSWYASNIAGSWLLLAGLAPGPVAAADTAGAVRCLTRGDVTCAHDAVEELAAQQPDSPEVGAIAAHVAFHEGRFVDALALMEAAAAALPDEDGSLQATAQLYRDTVEATRDFITVSRDGVVVRYAPGVDQILLDEVFETMTSARASLASLFGAIGQPIRVEIYPDARRFTLASSLGDEAVETTGVVALSKWSRLLMTSPRALALGYAWKDTLVHEYIHQVVTFQTDDRAPVWLQEGLAHYFETWWRGERDRPLGPMAQSLLAQALAEDNLVTFDEMHPSFAFLPSAERATLAYAQVRTLVDFAIQRGGVQALVGLMADVRDGMDARQALARAGGYQDFDNFYADALEYLRGLDLVERHLAALPTVVGEAEGYQVDPLLSRRQDLARYARLGDLLREAERPRAALVEYGKAMSDDEPESPMLANRMARCHAVLGELDTALALLAVSLEHYPGYGPGHKQMGELELRRGQEESALVAFRCAADINPFDPDLQGSLATLYAARGATDLAERHTRYLRILRTAGGGVSAPAGSDAGDAP